MFIMICFTTITLQVLYADFYMKTLELKKETHEPCYP